MRLQDIIRLELERMGGPLITLETGTIRSPDKRYLRGDGWSTLTFANYTKKNGGQFTSIDREVQSAMIVLSDPDLCGGEEDLLEYVDLREGDSRDELPLVVEELTAQKKSLDLVLLDSDNIASLTLDEFLLVRPAMRAGSVLLVDDVDLNSTEVLKGHEILPFLASKGHKTEIIQRDGDGFTTGVLKVIIR